MQNFIRQPQILEILTTGKFVSIDFRKKDGKFRTITGRIGVSKHTKGVGLSYSPSSRGLIVVWETTKTNRKDEKDKGYRMVSLDRILEIRANKNKYTVIR